MHERGGANLTADEDVPSPSARRAARSPRALLAFGLAALPAVAMWHLFRERTGIRLEDALITYRYAENLALGRGFVFNPGERVLGTTTPAYTVCLALLGYAFGTPLIPLISSVLCALFALAAGFLAFLTLAVSGVSRAVAALTALLLLGQPQVVVAATGGMETSLVLLCMTGSLWALRTGRTRAAVVACALLVLTRIDGVVWAGLVLLTVLAREPRRFAARFGLFALTLLPWLAFATWYFGSPVPHSVTAKRAVVYARDAALGPLENLHAHLTWFAQASGIRPEYQWLFVSPAPWLRAAIVVAFSLLFVAGARRVAVTSASRPLAIAVLFPFALGVVYWLGDAPRLFDWYLTPPLWCFTLVLGLGIEHGRRLVARLRSTGPRTVAGAALAGIVGLVVFNSVAGDKYVTIRHRQAQRGEDGLRRGVGEWIATNTPPDATVAMEAIGYQGTFARRRIVDLAGVISPDVVRIHRRAPDGAAAFHRILAELRPDYLVLRSFEVDRNESWFGGPLFATDEQADWFREHYAELRRFDFPSPSWGRAAKLTLFERR